MAETYIERINQFRIVYRDVRDVNDPQRRAILTLNGIDPDDNWTLQWSFTKKETAERRLQEQIDEHKEFCEKYGCEPFKEYKLIDAGSATEVERTAWF
jgi:hypothetical protein